MKRFWTKRLPAALLALLMTVCLAPAALADEPGEGHTHTFSKEWTKNSTAHWHECSCGERADEEAHDFVVDAAKSTAPTCYQSGTTVERCSVCGYERTITSAPTGDHDFDESRWAADDDYHWHECTTKGCTAASAKERHEADGEGKVTDPTCTEDGYITYTCAVCGKTYKRAGTKALGHNFVNGKCTRCGVKESTSTTGKNFSLDNVTVSKSVSVGSSIRTKINSYFTKTNFSTVTFGDPTGTSYGTLYADSDKSALKSREYTYSNSGGWPVKDLYFVAKSKAGTYKIPYTAEDDSGNVVEGTITIKVVSSSSSSSTSGSKITYEVKPGKSVTFSKSDFDDVYSAKRDDTLRYVTFTVSSISGGSFTVDSKTLSRSTLNNSAFYYSKSRYGDYALADLTFEADSDFDSSLTLTYYAYGEDEDDYVKGSVVIKSTGSSSSGSSGSSSSSGTISYSVKAGSSVAFKKSDFKTAYDKKLSGTVRYVTFETSSTLSASEGTLYNDYNGSEEKSFARSSLSRYNFYYSSSSYGDYALEDLSFVAPKGASAHTVKLTYTVYDSRDDSVTGTVEIKVTGSGTTSSSSDTLTYKVQPGKEVTFNRKDFNSYYQEVSDTTNTIKYVTFETSDTLSKTSSGLVYYNYGSSGEVSFNRNSIDDYKFYYSSASDGDYPLSGLSFVAGSGFTKAITLDFTAYYTTSKKATGKLVIQPDGTAATTPTTTVTSSAVADLVYQTAYADTVRINADELARFFRRQISGGRLQYVRLDGVPASGSLYYNYYGTSRYGSTTRKQLTASNCAAQNFYFSPTSTSQYSLAELAFVPTSGVNTCVTIPFTAVGATASQTVKGTILISATKAKVADVYGVTPKGTAVTLPASAIVSAVTTATGSAPAGIQLVKLPKTSVGTVYVGSGTSTKAVTGKTYGYNTGDQQMGQLRFVPASGHTGAVEIPYAAVDSRGNLMAAGVFSLGVVSSVKKFSDINSSTWCYKYVTELADAGVIGGYSDGSYRTNNAVTYGAALKLVMLAAWYPEQKPTGANVFSGYLDKARSEGIITRANVDLTKPITRLQVAQLAAGAMKLDTSNLSSVKPFTDTTDVYVQALNAAGVINGYFANGTSTYKPGNTLTRGQVAAIVWRMRNYEK
ncbi:MAG: S-layer homology domain-containing protein [Oscillibacter sp.]|nr:S-layer homology domain-containing protein [Oscillibacter sp.]